MKKRILHFLILIGAAILFLLPACCTTVYSSEESVKTDSSTVSSQGKKTKTYTKYNGVDLSRIYDFDYYVANNKYAKKHFKNKPKKAILYFGRYAIRNGVKAKARYSKSVYKKLYKKTHPFPKADTILDELDWNLKKAFEYAAKQTSYHGSDLGEYNQPYNKTSQWYFDYLRKNGRGNCYCKAAMFTILATELGYECTQIGGTIPYRSTRAPGPHSWVEIKYKGKTRVCDPAYYNTTGGASGWMIQYGQKGTYQYSTPHKMKKK